MKAFLSHSSKDKKIVQQVFEGLGAANSIYDSESFEEGKRSAEEIISSLSSTDIFVLFLSKNSLGSPYVINEIDYAIEKYFSGRILSVLIFALDNSTHEDLPDKLKEYKIFRTTKPAQIVRIIRSRIIDIEIKIGSVTDIFIGREKELSELQKALSLPLEEMKKAISIAGWDGLGRRTLANRAIKMIFPYLKRNQPLFTLGDNDSIEDFHRKLFDVINGEIKNSKDWIDSVKEFQAANENRRIEILLSLIKEASSAKEIIFVVGDMGLIKENGDYQDYINKIINALPKTPRPSMILIHRRRIPIRYQTNYSDVFFTAIKSFSVEETAQLLSAHFKQNEIDFNREDLNDLLRFVGGHPENIKIAVQYAKQYGLDQLRREKSDFVDILVFRASEILKRIEVSSLASAVCIALLDYHYLQIEDFVTCIDASDKEILEQLRYLEDNSILERIGIYYRVSPYLVNSIVRSDFHEKYTKERKKIGDRLFNTIIDVSEFDNVSLSLINASTLVAIRNNSAEHVSFIAHLLLPSHLLTIAREQYDSQNYSEACTLCREALKNKDRLTIDAQIEAYRLTAMGYLRQSKRQEFESTIENLRKYRGRFAKRNYYFLIGFQAKLDGKIDTAESNYRQAYNIDKKNFHVLRELASILCLQGRYSEAKIYAKFAYEIAPANPFIIDIYCEVLLRMSPPDKIKSNNIILQLLNELKTLGTDRGRSFYDEKMALLHQISGETQLAWEYATKALRRAPNHYGPRLTRIELSKILGKSKEIREDIEILDQINRDSKDKAIRFIVDRMKIEDAITNGNLKRAKALLDTSYTLPSFVRKSFNERLKTLSK